MVAIMGVAPEPVGGEGENADGEAKRLIGADVFEIAAMAAIVLDGEKLDQQPRSQRRQHKRQRPVAGFQRRKQRCDCADIEPETERRLTDGAAEINALEFRAVLHDPAQHGGPGTRLGLRTGNGGAGGRSGDCRGKLARGGR